MSPIRDEWQSPDGSVRILVGNVTDRLRDLPDESVHCVVTSPPYWGLRDYGTAEWEGGGVGCDHSLPAHAHGGLAAAAEKADGNHRNESGTREAKKDRLYKDVCAKCGARRIDQQIGLEETPDLYVARMVEVFREVRRVLRSDGTCWVNLGDSYTAGKQGRGDAESIGQVDFKSGRRPNAYVKSDCGGVKQRSVPLGMKPKDLVGIPWMVAFALRADGWYLRQDIIWAKPNPMPESVTDRCTKAHEYLFLLTKSARYFYDAEAVKEANADPTRIGELVKSNGARGMEMFGDGMRTREGFSRGIVVGTGRNRRSVWTIATAPYPEAHFATYPPALVIPCIQAGTSEKGCCPHCGKPWGRVVEKTKYEPPTGERFVDESRGDKTRKLSGKEYNEAVRVIGESWQPQCTCDRLKRFGAEPGFAEAPPVPFAPVPCVVLDPFLGSGTTAQVARQLNRHAIGIELNPEYALLARKRSMQRLDGEDDSLPLFEPPRNGKRQRELLEAIA